MKLACIGSTYRTIYTENSPSDRCTISAIFNKLQFVESGALSRASQEIRWNDMRWRFISIVVSFCALVPEYWQYGTIRSTVKMLLSMGTVF